MSRDDTHAPDRDVTPKLSRRLVLGTAVSGAVGLLVGRLAGPLLAPPRPATTPPGAAISVGPAGSPAAPSGDPFYGRHQAGVTTPAQDHLQLAAFDMVEEATRRDLVRLLQDWSSAAARMTCGLPLSAADALSSDVDSPAADTGEALGLSAGRMTVTIGFGPTLFRRDGIDRYRIATARPPELETLPSFEGAVLDPAQSDGDLCVQICADDPQVGLHALRNLARIAVDRAAIRWTQRGFIRRPGAPGGEGTPRNLMGFKDGTNNLRGEDHAAIDEHVWLPSTSEPAWLAHGTYLVVRKVEMLIEDWDLETVSFQESVFGRTKDSGAPLSGGGETTAPDFETTIGDADAIDPNAHIRLVHPSSHGGTRILRRGYNYFDGTKPDGRLDAGLLFIAFQRSPEQFIRLQRALATDKLNKYIRHVGSALFAVPPGASEGGFVGETLLG